MTPEQQAAEWLATVKERAMTRAQAEAVAEGTQFSSAQLELVEIGVLAGAHEMLDFIQELAAKGGPTG
jgi:hypothetical protein